MTTHVKVVAVLYLALSAFGIAAALFLSLALGVATGVVGANADPNEAAIAIPIIGLAGTALVVFLLATSLPGLIAGIGLLKYRPWARILAIVVAVINLIHIPFGTAIGIYALWVLFNKETEQLFSAAPPTVV
jgi:hypothetical protein